MSGHVLLRGDVLLVVAGSLEAEWVTTGLTLLVEQYRRDGRAVSERLARLVVDAESAAQVPRSVPAVDETGSDFGSWVSVQVASRDAGVSESFMRRLARTGRLEAAKPDGWSWRFEPEALAKWMRSRAA